MTYNLLKASTRRFQKRLEKKKEIEYNFDTQELEFKT